MPSTTEPDLVRTNTAVAQLEDQQLAVELSAISRKVAKRRLVLYFGRGTFADNTKYLFLRDAARDRGHEVLWCTGEASLVTSLRAEGLPCLDLRADIDQTIDVLLHAAVAVLCVNPSESLLGSYSLNACLAGAKKLQLWHGVSVKHLLLRLMPHLGVRDPGVRRAFYMASQADVVLSSASTFDRFWRECFGTRRLVRAGLPRNEVLLRPAEPQEMIGSDLTPAVEDALRSGRKNVLVVPTWQRREKTYLAEPTFAKHLRTISGRGKINVFYKGHPMYLQHEPGGRSDGSGFHVLDAGIDIYPWMRHFDALVTDYSSIMFDYLLTDGPVLTLDLGPDGHTRFEPDMSLVPDVPFSYRYTGADFEAQLRTALYDDHLSPQRAEMASQIFESDPLLASEQLLDLVDLLVDEALDEELILEGADG